MPWKAPVFAQHLLKKVLELIASYQPLTYQHFKTLISILKTVNIKSF